MTLILSRRDIRKLMSLPDWLEAVEQGFRAAAEGRAESPLPIHLRSDEGGFHAKAASLREGGRHWVALKFNGNFPANPMRHALPTIQGAILLCDGEDGRLLAILDSGEVTVRRTAAATALAALHLARADSRTLLICGCGLQGAAHVASLRQVRPIRSCLAWDQDPEKAVALAASDAGIVRVTDLVEAARRSDIIVTCTSASRPFLDSSHVAPGTFVAAVGADSPSKSEIDPHLTAAVTVVTDVLDQCAEMGDLHHALRAGLIGRDQVHAELADVVAGRKPGRMRDDEIILFDSTGTALQDVASAAAIHRKAMARGGLPVVALAA